MKTTEEIIAYLQKRIEDLQCKYDEDQPIMTDAEQELIWCLNFINKGE